MPLRESKTNSQIVVKYSESTTTEILRMLRNHWHLSITNRQLAIAIGEFCAMHFGALATCASYYYTQFYRHTRLIIVNV